MVPGVHEDLTTTRVLAMDYVDGEPLDSLAEAGVSQDVGNSVGALLQHLMFRELFEFRTMQSDPNFANYLYQPETAGSYCWTSARRSVSRKNSSAAMPRSPVR